MKLELREWLIESPEVEQKVDSDSRIHVSTLLNSNLSIQEATILVQTPQYIVSLCPDVDIFGRKLLSIYVAALNEEFALKGSI